MRLHADCKIEQAASREDTRAVIMTPWLDITPGKPGVDATDTMPAVEATEPTGRIVATNGRIIAIVPVHVDPTDVGGYVTAQALAAARKLRNGTVECNGALVLADGTAFPRPAATDEHGKSYPNWRQVIPAEDRPVAVKIALDVDLLHKLCKALGSMKVSLEFQDEREAVVVRTSGSEAAVQGAMGVIMPMRLS